MSGNRRFYEAPAEPGGKRSAPAALRNRAPIADVLAEWLPPSGLVLEIASGTGEHATFFAGRLAHLDWQPSDRDDNALHSIAAWRAASDLPNLHAPVRIDAAAAAWPVTAADAVLSINMVHISPWPSALGLIDGAARILPPGGPLILYGPWFGDSIDSAPSNLAFDAQLRTTDPAWGVRRVEQLTEAAGKAGFRHCATRAMPANNIMLLYRRGDAAGEV